MESGGKKSENRLLCLPGFGAGFQKIYDNTTPRTKTPCQSPEVKAERPTGFFICHDKFWNLYLINIK